MRKIKRIASGRYLRTRISWTSIAVQILMSIFCSGVPAAAQAPAHLARASAGELELPWSDLGSLVAGHRVKLVLPDTEVIQGQVVAVREDALVLNVNKTTNRQKYPKGQNV